MATSTSEFWEWAYKIEMDMNKQFETVSKPASINVIYNPTIYASELHCAYLRKYLNGTKRVLFLGMNPGPNGMCQTGIPFGDIDTVVKRFNLGGYTVQQPVEVHTKRPIVGLNCKKIEPSGKRLWALLHGLSGSSENLFRNCFVHNFCPLTFYDKEGKYISNDNLTRDDFIKDIEEICQNGLVELIKLIRPEVVVAIGVYAEKQVTCIKKKGLINETIRLIRMPHPSPARRGKEEKWVADTKECFQKNGIDTILMDNDEQSSQDVINVQLN